MFIFFLFRHSFHNKTNLHIVLYAWRGPLSFFFFQPVIHFFEFQTVTCVVTSFRAHLFLFFFIASSLWPKKVSWKVIFLIAHMLIKLGSSRLTVQSHRHFDLTCNQEINCFISGFSLFLGLWGWVTVLKFIVTCFFGVQSPGDAYLFAILDNAIPQCNKGIKMLCFSCLTCFPNSVQAFMHFRLIFGLLQIDIWTTSDQARVFPVYKCSFLKSFDPKSGFSFFREIF